MAGFTISGMLIDLFDRRTYGAEVTVKDGRIASIAPTDHPSDQYLLPGFVDAHIHIESSMLAPTAFAQVAVTHGTVATVSDPHEIANVLGLEGVQFMTDNSRLTPFKFFFGAPSCVPATSFETAGAELDAHDIFALLQREDIWYLSEMMNYPGVLNEDPAVMAKIEAAHRSGKPVDGHAPGLRGADAARYAAAGITTDHECFTLEEALDKVKAGMKILIREGSAARNYEALHELLRLHPDRVMFCSDDKHPDELVLHHINELVKRSLKLGYDLYDVLRAASVHPILHYRLPVGLLRLQDPADFIVVNNLKDFEVLRTYIDGELVAEAGRSLLPSIDVMPVNKFNTGKKIPADFGIKASFGRDHIRVIEAIEGQLVTSSGQYPAATAGGYMVADTERDLLKISVVNRYDDTAPVAVAFIKNFGLTHGAIASTVAHDCHNIIAVGADDESLCAAVNAVVGHKGGIAVADGKDTVTSMPLALAGLMSTGNGYDVAAEYTRIDRMAKDLGTGLRAPFMTLSFMALLVIPALKLSDKGLFDGTRFEFTDVSCSGDD